MSSENVFLYDTTLRDGAQTRGVDFSLKDKLSLAHKLDKLHIDYIEAGWPGANPIDTEFFSTPPQLSHAKLVAFGMMIRGNDDPLFDTVINSQSDALCLVGKTYDYHVKLALKLSLQENLDLLALSFKKAAQFNKELFFDAEHFFDGYKTNPDYALKCLETVINNGVSTVVLCDTNGGSMPHEIAQITQEIHKNFSDTIIGIHCHNDCELAVANSLIAVQAGARHIQGTINGLGERCGNANLCSIIANMALKEPFHTKYKTSIDQDRLKNLTDISHFLTDILNQPLGLNLPYVGQNAFAHKGGLHVSAVIKDPATYEHIQPDIIGNKRIIPVSTQSGRSNVMMRLKEFPLDFDLSSDQIQKILDTIKEAEAQGYSYDSAGASFYLHVLKIAQKYPTFFKIDDFRATSNGKTAEAIVKIFINQKRIMNITEGNGPVDALYHALLKDLGDYGDIVKNIQLVDYKVRIIGAGTAAVTRVLIDFKDHQNHHWSTVGVSHDIVQSSFKAILDSVVYYLKISGIPPIEIS